MRYGYHMGYGYYGPIILAVILAISIIILLAALLGNKNRSNPQIQTPLDILRERYAKGEIEAEEYRQKKDFIENEKHTGQAILILMKRYVNGEISEEEYSKIKKDIS